MRNDGRNALNGRCEKDALDRADDICELCGNQYCAQCLLFPRGHRNPPTCKTCALENSGIRGGGAKHHPISRREYKKRKKALLQQLEGVEVEAPPIEFFELHDPSQFDQSNELDRRPVVPEVEVEASIDILGVGDETASAPPPQSTAAPEPPISIPPPPAAAVPAPAPERLTAEHAIEGLAPVDTSINPLALGGSPVPPAPVPQSESVPPSSEASTSAAELLARLKADQPIQSQFTAAPVGLDTDPFATTTSELIAQPARDSAPTSAAPTQQRPVANPAWPTADPVPTKSEPWSPPAPPPRGSSLGDTDAFDQSVPTAPTAASPDRRAPSAFPPSPFDTSPEDGATARGLAAEANAADGGPERNPGRRKADLDESGQWIPPSLRGMTTDEDRGPLPKRR